MKNESEYLNNKINNKKMKNIKYDLTTKFPVNLDLGGFLRQTKIIIVDQKIKRMDHPEINAI